MKSIYFATGNIGKIATLKRHFKQHGVDILIKQGLVDIIEPQADTATGVAIVKARQAYDILKSPVIVDDSLFHISVLGGFPGPYIKYMLSTIGVDGILNFLKNHDDRSAYFLS
ncbi:MAG: non-canonical purine NTP pyrophosphatase, partial [Candidatus Saccharibacteria bacterium]